MCSLTGRVDAQNNGLSYTATISYFTVDPTKTASRLRSGAPAAGVSGQPKYAKISSQGIAAPVAGVSSTPTGSRYLSAVYTFKVTNVNIPGGRIFDGNNDLCLEAVPHRGSVGAGSFINFVSGAARAPPRRPTMRAALDLRHRLRDQAREHHRRRTRRACASPVRSNKKDGSTQDATLQACKAKTDATGGTSYGAGWGHYTWRGRPATSPLVTAPTPCRALPVAIGCRSASRAQRDLQPQLPQSGPVRQASTPIRSSTTWSSVAAWTSRTSNIDFAFMISYPCKQDPSGRELRREPVFELEPQVVLHRTNAAAIQPAGPTPPLTQTISVNVDNDATKKQCLETPDPSALHPTIYPIFNPCVTGANLQKWTRINNTGTYADSYLFVDSLGRCLSVGTDPNDLFGDPATISKIIVATCDNSLAQKWNSPPATSAAPSASYQEVAP